MHTWIKICGTTSLEDATAALAAGADALGFIFASSKRRVTLEQARAITQRLPRTVERIGVFVDESAAEIRATVEHAGLTGIQLHGEESPEFASGLFGDDAAGRALRIIKTVLVNDRFTSRLAQFCGERAHSGPVLLDSGSGSGRTFDWQEVQRRLEGTPGRFIIAGGLTPENVGQAVRTFAPWGVDVVSGVEQAPGRKNPEKLKAFIKAVRKAEEP
jgi:phosphoribosylanthranilate isomerase